MWATNSSTSSSVMMPSQSPTRASAPFGSSGASAASPFRRSRSFKLTSAAMGLPRRSMIYRSSPYATRAGPVAQASHVQVDTVDEPGDERRGLLRVPAPVAAPGRVRPVGAERYAYSQQREAH